MLSNHDLMELVEFRRELHRWPEISGEERETAQRIIEELKILQPDKIVSDLGGHGVAAVFDSGLDGPTVLFRAELDALPIQEVSNVEWASKVPGKGHLCGHDGHMTMLLALGRLLVRKPVKSGRVVLLFQPAEEDGSGARAVVADPRFVEISPDWAFAIHIEPGKPFGYVATKPGLINCASRGLSISLAGKTAHAATPTDGISPIDATMQIIQQIRALGSDGSLDDDYRLATITHVNIGEPTFGISPGEARIFVTLRTTSDVALKRLSEEALTIVRDRANAFDLDLDYSASDDFAASVNSEEAVEIARSAMTALSISHGEEGLPMLASEDFGVFGWQAKAAMLCLGPGETYPALHNPDYDFPDDLIPLGASLFEKIARDILDQTAPCS